MKQLLQSIALTTGLILTSHAFAQTPAMPATPAAPAKPAMTAPAAVVQPAAPTMPAATAPATPAKKGSYKVPDAPAAGGGDGKVWVNSSSKTYHCPGTKYYGKTKAGEYMSEADAKAKGFHGIKNKNCA